MTLRQTLPIQSQKTIRPAAGGKHPPRGSVCENLGYIRSWVKRQPARVQPLSALPAPGLKIAPESLVSPRREAVNQRNMGSVRLLFTTT
jgi:hypothetical protein